MSSQSLIGYTCTSSISTATLAINEDKFYCNHWLFIPASHLSGPSSIPVKQSTWSLSIFSLSMHRRFPQPKCFSSVCPASKSQPEVLLIDYRIPGLGPDPNWTMIRLSRLKWPLIRLSRPNWPLIRLNPDHGPENKRLWSDRPDQIDLWSDRHQTMVQTIVRSNCFPDPVILVWERTSVRSIGSRHTPIWVWA